MSKTIRELADELGVSKTAVRKYMTEDFRAQHTANLLGNIIQIDEDGCKLIAESLRKPSATGGNSIPETTENQGLRDEVAFLRGQLEAKVRQLEAQLAQLATKETEILNLTAALENTTKSLHAAQALHAGTMQAQLGAGEQQGEAAVDADDQQQAAPPRKWWQFWR